MTNAKRDELRALQDKLLALPIMKRFAKEAPHGKNGRTGLGGGSKSPTVADLETMLYPDLESEIRQAIAS